MDDPNVTYKRAFAELREELGRLPTANELLGLHDAYKKAFLSLPTEVEKADKEFAMRQQHMAEMAAAGRPAPEGFSRKPAPQAGAVDAREVGLSPLPTEPTRRGWADRPREEPLTNPRAGATREEPVSAPERLENKPGAPGGLCEGDRGPGGGLMCKCRACGRLWERERKKGRPAYTCGECR